MAELRLWFRNLVGVAILSGVLSGLAWAQSREELAAAQARYQQELANCRSNASAQDPVDCVKEARNSFAEIKRGQMKETAQPADFERNAMLRCEVHLGIDKSACVARIHGEGRTEGSVSGGGILREVVTIIPN